MFTTTAYDQISRGYQNSRSFPSSVLGAIEVAANIGAAVFVPILAAVGVFAGSAVWVSQPVSKRVIEMNSRR